MDQETQIQIDSLQSQINEMKRNPLTLQMDTQTTDRVQDLAASRILDIFWDELYYISSFATTSIDTIATETLDANGRESDTSAGLYFLQSRPSRFKARFYLDGVVQTKVVVYITSPATSQSSSIGSSIKDSNKSFVGLKIDQTVVYLVAYDHTTQSESLKSTGKTILDNTTHILEIRYYVTNAVILLDNQEIGTIDCKLVDDRTFVTFFPFLTSVGSTDGTSVNLTIEGFEFSQTKK